MLKYSCKSHVRYARLDMCTVWFALINVIHAALWCVVCLTGDVVQYMRILCVWCTLMCDVHLVTK